MQPGNSDFVENFLLRQAKLEIIFISTLDEINDNLHDRHLAWILSPSVPRNLALLRSENIISGYPEIIDSETCESLLQLML